MNHAELSGDICHTEARTAIDHSLQEIERAIDSVNRTKRAALLAATIGIPVLLVYVWMSELRKSDSREVSAYATEAVMDADTGIIATHADGTICKWMAGSERLLGYSPGDMDGHNIQEIMPLQDGCEPQAVPDQPFTIAQSECVAIHQDGHEVPLHVSKKTTGTKSGECVIYIIKRAEHVLTAAGN